MEEVTGSFDSLNENNRSQEKDIKSTVNLLQKKIDTIEEKYFITGEMNQETYEKFLNKVTKEKQEILSSLQNTSVSSSNLKNHLDLVASFSSKLAPAWSSSPVKAKERLQKLVFPDGISYCTKKEAFLTSKTNSVFQLNADLNSVSEDDIKKQGGKKATLSCLVGRNGQISNQLIKDLKAIREFLSLNE